MTDRAFWPSTNPSLIPLAQTYGKRIKGCEFSKRLPKCSRLRAATRKLSPWDGVKIS